MHNVAGDIVAGPERATLWAVPRDPQEYPDLTCVNIDIASRICG